MGNEQTIDVLNKLVTINNDRIKGYETASEETEEQDLKTLFREFSDTSKSCKRELDAAVEALDGNPSDDTKNTGKLYRVWMDVKAALTGKNRKVILDSCEFGEDAARDTYEKVLEEDLEYLNIEQVAMIRAQHALLNADHVKVKAMRDLAMAD